MATSYTSLEPNFQQGAGLPNLSSVATGGSLLPATSFIFMMFFAACVVAAGLRIVWGAGLMLPGTPSGLTKAKEVFKKAIFGLLGVSVAYLVIQTINPDLLKGEVDLSKLRINLVNSTEQADTIPAPAGTIPITPSVGGSDAEYRKRLLDAGVGINGNVSFEGINPSTIDMLISLKSACSCVVLITSAVRTGSATSNHRPGMGAVDLAVNSGLTNFLKNSGTVYNAYGSRGGCNVRDSWGGWIFWYEWDQATNSKCTDGATGPHYHVSLNGR